MTSPTYSHGDPNYLSDTQLAQLLKGINPLRVNKDAKGMSHVEAYEIRAHLTRIFGPLRWDEQITDQRLIFESVADKRDKNGAPVADKNGEPIPVWTVCWYAHCALTVRSATGATLATYGEGATGDATNFPSRADAHDMAAKTAASQALKRCAMNLGDQFGLSLYQKGSIRPLVGRTLIWGPTDPTADVAAHITSPLAPEGAEEGGESQRETSSPPVSKAPAAVTAPPAAGGGGRASGEPAPAVDPAGTRAHGIEGNPGAGTPGTTVLADGSEVSTAALAEQNGQGEADPTAPDAAGDSRAASGEPASDPASSTLPDTAPPSAPTSATDAEFCGEPCWPNGPACELFGGHPGAHHGAFAEPEDDDAEPEPDEEPAAEADPTPAASTDVEPDPAPAPAAEPAAEDPIDAWERITATMAVIRMTPPEEALGVIAELMETSAKHKLGSKRFGEDGKALAVVLVDTMKAARAAVEKRKAAAAAGS